MMRRASTLLLAVGSVVLLTACGDDISISVPVAESGASVYAVEAGKQEFSEENEERKSPIVTPEPVQMKETVQKSSQESSEEISQEISEDIPEDISEEISEEPSEESAAEPPEESESDPEENIVEITISAAGDVTMGNYLGQDYSSSFRETYENEQDDSYFFENVFDIFSADDMTLVNLEGPLTTASEGRTDKTYCISGDPSYAKILTAGSVEAVSMGNNHRLDYFEQGCDDTVKAVENEGIVYAYDANVGIYETKGIRIGYVSASAVGQEDWVGNILKKGIEKLKEEEVDLIIACCHWGIEREFYPEENQMSLGRQCIDWGADLVIGCHPHVIQGIEEYQGKFIVYSLGNFCFGANRNPADKDCIIFQQTFTFENGEKQDDARIRVIPCSVSSVSYVNDYKPTPASGSEAQRIMDRVNEYSSGFGIQFDSDGYLQD